MRLQLLRLRPRARGTGRRPVEYTLGWIEARYIVARGYLAHRDHRGPAQHMRLHHLRHFKFGAGHQQHLVLGEVGVGGDVDAIDAVEHEERALAPACRKRTR